MYNFLSPPQDSWATTFLPIFMLRPIALWFIADASSEKCSENATVARDKPFLKTHWYMSSQYFSDQKFLCPHKVVVCWDDAVTVHWWGTYSNLWRKSKLSTVPPELISVSFRGSSPKTWSEPLRQTLHVTAAKVQMCCCDIWSHFFKVVWTSLLIF